MSITTVNLRAIQKKQIEQDRHPALLLFFCLGINLLYKPAGAIHKLRLSYFQKLDKYFTGSTLLGFLFLKIDYINRTNISQEVHEMTWFLCLSRLSRDGSYISMRLFICPIYHRSQLELETGELRGKLRDDEAATKNKNIGE